MFSRKLKKLRTEKQLSMEALAHIYNEQFDARLNKSTISRYENGLQQPMYNVVKNFAQIFLVSVDYLSDNEQADTEIPSGCMALPDTSLVPLVGNIACGTPIFADENIEDYLHVPKFVDADFCLKCRGDSMINARIFDGDIVFVHRQPDVEDGEIAVVLLDDCATLKRVYKKKNFVILKAENPTFEDIIIEGEQLNNVRIQGKAVAFLSTVR